MSLRDMQMRTTIGMRDDSEQTGVCNRKIEAQIVCGHPVYSIYLSGILEQTLLDAVVAQSKNVVLRIPDNVLH